MALPATQHPEKVVDLTKRQIAVVRANQARKASKLMTRLEKCAQGKQQMSSQQIKAAEIFLRKVVPDLSAMQVTEDGGQFDNMSREELANYAAGLIKANPAFAQLGDLMSAIAEQSVVAEVVPMKDDDD